MADLICTCCGERGTPKTITKGSIFIELILWCAFLVPGLLYSFWRHASRYRACRSCGSTTLVPLKSPMGAKMMREYAAK